MRSKEYRFVPLSIAVMTLTLLLGVGAFASITTPLTRYSGNPHYLANNGTPVVFLGTGQVLSGNKATNYRADIDEMAAHKSNYARVWALNVWKAREEYMPWARDGGGTAVDGGGKYNLTHWDSNYWSRLKDACAYAQSKNMYISIMVFDRCGMDTPTSSTDHRWDWHPFNPSNNINGLSLPTSPNGLPEFYDLGNSKLKSLQEQYVSKLISETSGYPNVIYEICNEYTGDWTWEKYWVDYVNARCSNIISVNHLGTSSSNTPSSAWSDSVIDMIKIHWSDTSPSFVNSSMLGVYSKNRPVNYDETPETSGISYTNYRNMIWATFVGAGHCHLENGVNPSAGLDAVLHIQNFIQTNGVRFWEMAPSNSAVTSDPGGTAYTLAKSGSEYVVYIVGSGSGSMTMNLPSGSYTAKAYNPSNGTYTNLTVSGTTISGIPSYSSDIVIYVKSGSSGGSVSNPAMTVTMTVDKTSAKPGDTITYTLNYRNTGAGAATSVAVTAPVPSNTSYTSGSASSGGTYDSATRTMKWSIPSVSAGASGVLTFRVGVN